MADDNFNETLAGKIYALRQKENLTETQFSVIANQAIDEENARVKSAGQSLGSAKASPIKLWLQDIGYPSEEQLRALERILIDENLTIIGAARKKHAKENLRSTYKHRVADVHEPGDMAAESQLGKLLAELIETAGLSIKDVAGALPATVQYDLIEHIDDNKIRRIEEGEELSLPLFNVLAELYHKKTGEELPAALQDAEEGKSQKRLLLAHRNHMTDFNRATKELRTKITQGLISLINDDLKIIYSHGTFINDNEFNKQLSEATGHSYYLANLAPLLGPYNRFARTQLATVETFEAIRDDIITLLKIQTHSEGEDEHTADQRIQELFVAPMNEFIDRVRLHYEQERTLSSRA